MKKALMRRVLFLGNCQAGSLAGVYRQQLASEVGDEVRYLPTSWPLSASDAALVEGADVIVEQVFDFRQAVTLDEFAHKAHVVRFPTVSGAFLWPFSGGAHPRNASFYFILEGPYPAEIGDRHLNRMIADRVEPDEAVARYLDLDIDARVNLDKRCEIIIRQQRRRDAVADFPTAELIERHFRDDYIFFSPYHPGPRLFRLLMTGILERIGLDPDSVLRMERLLTYSPLDHVWLPIHPAVARHFGLTYIAEDQRYKFLEGRFTFAEWAGRYMRYEWNPVLTEGAFLSHEPEAAVEKLQIGLLRSPFSARGHFMLAENLYRLNRLDYAAAALGRAIELDPDEPRFKASLGHVMAARGETEAAALAFGQALEAAPDDAGLQNALSHALCGLGRFEEAILPARRVIELHPGRPGCGCHLGNICAQCGYLQEAELAYRDALEREPANAAVHGGLGRTLAALERFEEAIMSLRQAVALDPDNPHLGAELANLLARQQGGVSAAEQPAPEPKQAVLEPEEAAPEAIEAVAFDWTEPETMEFAPTDPESIEFPEPPQIIEFPEPPAYPIPDAMPEPALAGDVGDPPDRQPLGALHMLRSRIERVGSLVLGRRPRGSTFG